MINRWQDLNNSMTVSVNQPHAAIFETTLKIQRQQNVMSISTFEFSLIFR